ncbi:MAG: leucyl aminopeptidase [Chlorobi bacterium]|nr:leucyl aminopeptidase [Chlorobiota bacterium]
MSGRIQLNLEISDNYPESLPVFKVVHADSMKENSDEYVKKAIEEKVPVIPTGRDKWLAVLYKDKNKEDFYVIKEEARRLASKVESLSDELKLEKIAIVFDPNELETQENEEVQKTFVEGLVLANYRFVKYKSKPEKHVSALKGAVLSGFSVSQDELSQLLNVLESVYYVRDLVNEPPNMLTAEDMANSFYETGTEVGIKVTILNKDEIEKENMAGLLAVNRGSAFPPTFTIMEYMPKNAVNEQPIVLVGKGIVFDTGGVSLKSTPNNMDWMKMDMGGGATVAGIIEAIARNKLPLKVVALIPATDNRPGPASYLPDDVIKYSDGTIVEVLNTDAEGRLVLADALIYARRYNPLMIIDFATLTGSTMRATGPYAAVMFSTLDREKTQKLLQEGFETYERMVEFPLWEEYGNDIKSAVADIKNVGGPYAGAITAAKFLQHFVKYPWVHVDIAGTAFLDRKMHYLPKGGTGWGVRMLYSFLKKEFLEN